MNDILQPQWRRLDETTQQTFNEPGERRRASDGEADIARVVSGVLHRGDARSHRELLEPRRHTSASSSRSFCSLSDPGDRSTF